MNVPACDYSVSPAMSPGSCTYWVVAVNLQQLHDAGGNYCLQGDSFNPACANIGIRELLQHCDGWNTGGNDCFGYYSNSVQIFPNVSDSFDWVSAKSGFRDVFFVFLYILVVWAVVKVLNMGAK